MAYRLTRLVQIGIRPSNRNALRRRGQILDLWVFAVDVTRGLQRVAFKRTRVLYARKFNKITFACFTKGRAKIPRLMALITQGARCSSPVKI